MNRFNVLYQTITNLVFYNFIIKVKVSIKQNCFKDLLNLKKPNN